MGSPVKEHPARVVIAGVIGNVLEWYDFALFGFFAAVISDQFFPHESRLASLLQTFGVFAVGYLMRPLGGVIFGHIGDRLGRKKALELSVLLMALPTTALGLLPTYHQIGMAAPILLTLIRVLQGISVGGELIGSVSFLGEQAPPGRRGWLGSWSMCSSCGGILLGSGVAALLTALIPADDLARWGWRIPFVCGIGVGLVGLWLRTGIEESASFQEAERAAGVARSPVAEALRDEWRAILLTVGFTLGVSAGFYVPFVWLSTWLAHINQPPLPEALQVNTIAMAVLLVLIPAAGALSDRLGRKRVLLVGAAAYGLLAYPAFLLLAQATFATALAGQLLFAVTLSMVAGPSPATYVEMFPTRTRYSGIAIGYNLAQALFGGTAPLIATYLIDVTGNRLAPAYFLVVIAAITFIAVLLIPDRSGEPLRQTTGHAPGPVPLPAEA